MVAQVVGESVCGIGNPTSFTRLVGELARIIGEPLIFPDHHHYSRRDAERIAAIESLEARWQIDAR